MVGKVDQLKLYFGDPYPITDKISVYQPTIQQIVFDYGEENYYSTLFIFIGNTTMRKLFLWENGIDWNKLSDYEMFCNLVKLIPVEQSRIFFGDIDFQKFDLYELNVEYEEEPVDPNKKLNAVEKNKRGFRKFEHTHTFYSEEQDIEISAGTYHDIVKVMREMTKIAPKTEYTIGKTSKELLIQEEREKLARAEKEEEQSSFLPLISFALNHPGFKYSKDELRNVQIYEFMDSVKRLQIWEATHALYQGVYSGFTDTSKIPKKQFDFTRND